MKNIFLVLLIHILSFISYGQVFTNDYIIYVKEAESFYKANNFIKSATSYSLAFGNNKGEAKSIDRYKAACSWALAHQTDSAFNYLYHLAQKNNYQNLLQITTDSSLNCLHTDKRYETLIELIKENKISAERKLNKSLIQQLDSIFFIDQYYRSVRDSLEKINEKDTVKLNVIQQIIHINDSINLNKVEIIIDKYGWLGCDVIGEKGNTTIFLIIKHADLHTQEKYLPKLAKAFREGKASGEDLAILTDIVEMQNNRPQIYGTQVLKKDGKYFVYTILEEINVNKRRTLLGLESIKIYLKSWNIEYVIPTK